MSEEERQSHVRYLSERAGFASRPEGVNPIEVEKQAEQATPSMDEYGITNEAWSEPKDSEDEIGRAQTSEEARFSTMPIIDTDDDQARAYIQDREQQPQRPHSYTRPWATPNRQRETPSYLEHKERRRQQLEQQQSSSQAPLPPAFGVQHQERVSVTSNAISQSQNMPSTTQRNLPLDAPYLSSPQRSSHLSAINDEARRTYQRPTSLPKASTFLPQQTHNTPALSAPPCTTAPTSPPQSPTNPYRRSDFPLPNRTSIRGLPSYLQHLRLSLSPPPPVRGAGRPVIYPPPFSAEPENEHDNTNVARSTAPPSSKQAEPLQHHRANSLATSVHVNVGHDTQTSYDASTMPMLPTTSPYRHPVISNDGPAAPVWNTQAVPTEPGRHQLPGQRNEHHRTSPREAAIAKWQRDVAFASNAGAQVDVDTAGHHTNTAQHVSEPQSPMTTTTAAAMPGAWPLPDTTPAVEAEAEALMRVGNRCRSFTGSGREGGAAGVEEGGAEDEAVVLSSTLDGPGWEWRPDGDDGEEGL